MNAGIRIFVLMYHVGILIHHVGKPLYHVGKSIYQVGKFDRKGWIRKLCFQRLFNKLSTLFKCKPFTFAVTA